MSVTISSPAHYLLHFHSQVAGIAVIEQELSRLSRIDQLLRTGDHAALEALTLQEMPQHLLSEECLDAARALKLSVTVIYLSTLAVENLPKPTPFNQWLAVYQSLSRGVENDGLQSLPSHHPLRVVTKHLLPGNPVAAGELRQCKGSVVVWRQALELAFDHARYDLVLRILRTLLKKKLDILDWLRIAESMTRRQAFIKNDHADASLGQAYLLIREQLRSPRAKVIKARSTLSLCASYSFFQAREYSLSVMAAQLASGLADRTQAAYETARAHCHLGDLTATVEWLDRLITLMDVASIELVPQSQPKFVPADAARALYDLQHTLSASGQKAFLVSGTLLGFAREGKILDHDKDLDVGIIGWEQQFDVSLVLLQSRRFRVNLRHLRADQTYQIPLQHLDTGVLIDIFVYHREGGKMVTGVESNFGYLQKFAFTPFELKLVSFLGIDFFVPADVELNLAENFGDWRQSDPDYISHLQSPSTVDVGGLVFQVVGRLRAIEAIRAKKHERLARVIDLMTLHQQCEGGMSEAALSVLRAELARHRPAAVASLPGVSHV
jgi:hypothetical protein